MAGSQRARAPRARSRPGPRRRARGGRRAHVLLRPRLGRGASRVAPGRGRARPQSAARRAARLRRCPLGARPDGRGDRAGARRTRARSHLSHVQDDGGRPRRAHGPAGRSGGDLRGCRGGRARRCARVFRAGGGAPPTATVRRRDSGSRTRALAVANRRSRCSRRRWTNARPVWCFSTSTRRGTGCATIPASSRSSAGWGCEDAADVPRERRGGMVFDRLEEDSWQRGRSSRARA